MATVEHKKKKSLSSAVIVEKHEWFEAKPLCREERYYLKFR